MKSFFSNINWAIFIATLLTLGLMNSCGRAGGEWDASGVFEATEVIVSAETSGKLEQFEIEEGDQLIANEVIGYVDTTQLHLQKMQLIASNRATLSQHRSVPRQIASLKEQIATQEREFARFKALLESNAATQKQVDDIESNIRVLKGQLSAQEEVLTQSNIGVGEQSSSIEVQIAQIEDMLVRSRIKSPINGIVLSKYAEAGELTTQGRALFKVANIEKLYLRAYITADQLTRCKLGDTVTVYSDWGEKGAREHTGTITWLSDQAEFTPKTIQTRNERANLVYAVKILVENDGYIKRGMYGEVKF